VCQPQSVTIAEWLHPRHLRRSRPGTAGEAGQRRLTPQELLVLQLLARGYTPGEIAVLVEAPVPDVLAALEASYAALGVSAGDWRAAVDRARRRGLIV
jgi:DNA-binding NarL/FixJ family response regulator